MMMVKSLLLGATVFFANYSLANNCEEKKGAVRQDGNAKYQYYIEIRTLKLSETGDLFGFGEVVPFLNLGKDLKGSQTQISVVAPIFGSYWTMPDGEVFRANTLNASERIYIPYSEIKCNKLSGDSYFLFNMVAFDMETEYDSESENIFNTTPEDKDPYRISLEKSFESNGKRDARNINSEYVDGEIAYTGHYFYGGRKKNAVNVGYRIVRIANSESAGRQQIERSDRDAHLGQVVRSHQGRVKHWNTKLSSTSANTRRNTRLESFDRETKKILAGLRSGDYRAPGVRGLEEAYKRHSSDDRSIQHMHDSVRFPD